MEAVCSGADRKVVQLKVFIAYCEEGNEGYGFFDVVNEANNRLQLPRNAYSFWYALCICTRPLLCCIICKSAIS